MRKQDTLRRVLSALRPYRLYLLLSLLAAAGILVGSGQVVQAAENVIGIQ